MPIFQYVCPQGHEFEFFKLRAAEAEPKRCKKCKKKLTKVVGGTSWAYTRGKNKSWPLADPVVDDKPSGKEFD